MCAVNNKYTQTHTSMMIETTTTICHAYNSMGTKRLVCAIRGVKTGEFIISCKRIFRLISKYHMHHTCTYIYAYS